MTNAYQVPFAPVAQQPEELRGAFVVRVYQHLALAIVAFMAFEVVLFKIGAAEALYDFLASGGSYRWLMILGGFMVVNRIAAVSVSNLDNPGLQYAGLFGMAGAEAVIFAPFLFMVFNSDNAGSIWQAAAITAVGFAGLTVIGFVTKRDLSFMRPLIMWGSLIAIGLIVIAVFFGFNLGIWFSIAMVGLSGASILYQTQKIIRQYPANAHVAAAVGLFGSVMMMFWYVLRLMNRR